MKEILYSPFFGLVLSIGIFELCRYISKKTKLSLFNPLLLSTVLIIAILTIFKIPYEAYNVGGTFITLFLAPATTVLGYSIYKQLRLLKQYFIPIVAGCFIGSITSMTSVYLLCRLFRIEEMLLASLIPKSVTTPIAMEVSATLNGIPSITVAAVVVTGIFGSLMCPILIKVFHINNSIASGVGIGACSHAAGTSKALELGEIEGAMSSIAIGVSGIITVILSLFL